MIMLIHIILLFIAFEIIVLHKTWQTLKQFQLKVLNLCYHKIINIDKSFFFVFLLLNLNKQYLCSKSIFESNNKQFEYCTNIN